MKEKFFIFFKIHKLYWYIGIYGNYKQVYIEAMAIQINERIKKRKKKKIWGKCKSLRCWSKYISLTHSAISSTLAARFVNPLEYKHVCQTSCYTTYIQQMEGSQMHIGFIHEALCIFFLFHFISSFISFLYFSFFFLFYIKPSR